MPYRVRKFVAVLMLLWLPLFSGSALASTVAMQMAQGACDEAAAPQAMPAMDDMSGMDMAEQHHGNKPASADGQDSSCNHCGICHLACTAYLAVPSMDMAAVQATAHDTVPYLVSFRSITAAPLLPPPLARA